MSRKASSHIGPQKPLTAFLMPREFVKSCFAESDMTRLRERCEVRDAGWEEVKPADVAELGADAEVWITGWGTPALPVEAFARAPRLRLIAHSAGSTRHLLPEDFWTRGIALATANRALAIPKLDALGPKPDVSRYFDDYPKPDGASINGLGVLEIPARLY